MLYKAKYKSTLPKDAKRIKRAGVLMATWARRDGKIVSAEIRTDETGMEYISLETKNWYARFTDSQGRAHQFCTGTHIKDAAQAKLNDHIKRREQIKAGYIPASEEHANVARARVAITDCMEKYVGVLRTKGRSDKHIEQVERVIKAMRSRLNRDRLIDITPDAITQYLLHLLDAGMSARTRGHHKTLLYGFLKFCVQRKYTDSNAAEGMENPDIESDRRYQRRPLTDADIGRLLDAAAVRPLHNEMHCNTGEVRNMSAARAQRLEMWGREHRLWYLTMLVSGARWSELRAVTVKDLDLTEGAPKIILRAENTKNKKTEPVSLSTELAQELKAWIRDTARIGKAMLFDMPLRGKPVFNRDCAFAEIPLETDEGVIDLHSLRHTCGHRMLKNGVPLVVVQRHLRHSTPDITVKVYGHIGISDTATAVNNMPSLTTRSNEVANTAE